MSRFSHKFVSLHYIRFQDDCWIRFLNSEITSFSDWPKVSKLLDLLFRDKNTYI
jgi:hypothetical protein